MVSRDDGFGTAAHTAGIRSISCNPDMPSHTDDDPRLVEMRERSTAQAITNTETGRRDAC